MRDAGGNGARADTGYQRNDNELSTVSMVVVNSGHGGLTYRHQR
jgi:hypothetical protein